MTSILTGVPPPAAAAPADRWDMGGAPAPLSQADLLRAVGHFLDRRGWRDVRVVRDADGVIVQGRPTGPGQPAAAYETARLADGHLRAWLADAWHHRSR